MNLLEQVTQPTPGYRTPILARYREVFEPNHPLASKSGRVQIHRDILYRAIGPGEHACRWCGKAVHWTVKKHEPGALVVDHIDRDIFNVALDNLAPSCNHCNLDRQRRLPCPIVEVGCPQCGVIFGAKANIHGIPYRRFCSRSCVSANQSVVRRRPDIQVECVQCRSLFKARPPTRSGKRAVRLCSTSCKVKWQWAQGALKPMQRTRKGQHYCTFHGDHPLTANSANKATGEHRVVLYNEIGPGPHLCHWCGKLVNWRIGMITKGCKTADDLVADHLDGDRRNNALDNLVPSCNSCNSGRSRRKPLSAYVCEECGARFDRHPSANPKWNRFCGGSCRSKFLANAGVIGRPRRILRGEPFILYGKARLRAEERQCPHCSRKFIAAVSRGKKFCSHQCYGDSLRGRPLTWRQT